MSHEKCTRCGEVYSERDIEEGSECTFAETRYEPAEYEFRCSCGSTDFEQVTICDECGVHEAIDGTDICADCFNDLDPEGYAEYLAGSAA